MSLRWLPYICFTLLLSGCSGQLKVFDSDQKEVAGLPFRAVEVYRKEGIRTAHNKGGNCTPIQFSHLVSLPTGAQYFVNASSAELAKTEFTIKYTEAGTLSEVTLNSEPAAAEPIKAVNELAKTLLPVAGLAAASPVVAAAGAPAPACDTGENNVTYTKLVPN